MAKLPANLTRIYLDQYNLSGDLNGWTQKVEQEAIVVTCLSDTGPRRLVGQYDHADDFTGFFDGDAAGIDAIVNALIAAASDHYYAKILANSLSSGLPAENSVAYESLAQLASEPLSGQVGGAVLLNISTAGSGGLSRGVVLRAAAVTATGQGTGRNLGATTAGTTFQAVVRVLSVSGSGSITVRIQESQNDGSPDTYADISGMTTTLTGVGVARLTTTAATEAWKRVSVQAFSGFTSVTLLVTAGNVAG